MPTIPPSETTTRDITFEVGEFDDNPAIVALREQKPQIFDQVQAYYDATVAPDQPGTISLQERALIAQRVAAGIPSPLLANWYQHRLDSFETGAIDEASPRIQAMLARVSLVNANPDATTHDDVRALQDAGLDETAIISLSQLIAFVQYQARLHAGLTAIGAAS
ncbi:MAG: hypothetical protein ACR2OU_21805 [Thermomicrobiales bacterium]